MTEYVIDTSAVHRFFREPDLYPRWKEVIARGEVGIIPLVEFEVCYSARQARERAKLLTALSRLFVPLTPGPEVNDTARSMQEALTAKGAHRSCGPVDLVLAATAHVEARAVLHVDKDYVTLARHWPSFHQVRLDTDQPL